MKEIANEIRMILVVKLADLLVTIAPKNPDGLPWIQAIHDVTDRELKKGLRN